MALCVDFLNIVLCIFIYTNVPRETTLLFLHTNKCFNRMKFTQNEAAKKISGILTRGGKDLQMSERSINENLDSLMKLLVNDETELDDFIGKVRPIFETMNNNAKKDISDFANKWKEEHPETEPTKTIEQKPTESPEMKVLMERIAALEKDKAESEKKASIAQKRKDLAAKLKEKGVTDSEWIDLQFSKVNFDREIDMDAETADYVKLYNKSRSNGSGAPAPLNPSGAPANKGFMDSINAAKNLAKIERAVIEPK